MKRQRVAKGRFEPKKRFAKAQLNKPYYRRQNAYIPLKSTGEKKSIDVTASPQVSTTGVFQLLNGCVPGTGLADRIGRKIVLKSLYIRGTCQTDPSTAPLSTGTNTAAQHLRMIIFYDMQPNGAAPVTADLLATSSTVSQINLNNRDRFTILCDKTFVLDPVVYNTTATQALVQASNQLRQYKKFKRLNQEVIFNAGTAGTVADINTGALYVFWLGTGAVGVGTDANANYTCRVRFLDP